MSSKLYDLMDWRNIEGVAYADLDDPAVVLGVKNLKNERLIRVFQPDAVKVEAVFDISGKTYEMEEMDESYFAVLVPKKESGLYQIKAYYSDDTTYQHYDPYEFIDILPAKELKKFNLGTNYEVYEYLGAHTDTIQGVDGVRFAVWAPYAERVSVVGDFNYWDGRRHMMRRVGDTGVFELFIPGMKQGGVYKYEIKRSDGTNVLKADPYAFAAQKRPDNASIVCSIDGYKWTDDRWMADRENIQGAKKPVSIYEVHLGSWKKPETDGVEEKEAFYNYRELAPLLADYVKDMNYTHVELMPIMEHPLDASWGYQVTGYYAPTARYGTPEDFMYFIDYMHKKKIGVIIDWVPAHFPKDEFGLAKFDGTCLYEHFDPRQGEHPHWGTLIYNYGRPEVKDFLISNAVFWTKKYHVDGIRMDAVASMLYLDYGKNDGEWVANMYGGNENLEAMDFLRELNKQLNRTDKSLMVIAEESTAWPMVTGSTADGGLGFDYKWNMGWMNDFTSYMKCDPYFRKNNYHQLTFSMIYNYSEKFILVLSHDEVVHGKCSMISKMPGDEPERFANLRAAYAFMMAHPGRKLLFMGQEFAHYREWSEERQLDWASLLDEKHKNMQSFVRELNRLYISENAFHELDYSVDGFEWIDNMSYEKNICAFVRKGSRAQDMYLVVCNFDTLEHENYTVGVPKAGKYKEVLNSDDETYGGNGFVNKRVKVSKKERADGRENSITIKLAPLSVAIFKYTAQKSPVAKQLEEQYIAVETEPMAAKQPIAVKPVTTAKQPAAKAEAKQPAAKAEAKPAAKAEAKPAAKAETKPAVKAETKPAVKAEAKPAVKAEAKPAAKAKAKQPAAKAKAKPAAKAEAKPAAKAETKPAAKAKAKSAAKAETKPAVKQAVSKKK